MRKIIDYGGKSGLWTLVCEGVMRISSKGKHIRYIHCICACGNEKDVKLADLFNGKSTNCGCIKKQKIVARNYKHGFPRDKYYFTWSHIKSRCYNSKNKDYVNYGGRGIIMADYWINDFTSFRQYITSLIGYDNCDLTLDRINTNGNYEMGNLRWATDELQARNRRKPSNNTTGYKGVSFSKGKYVSTIQLEGKHKEIGAFDSAIEAYTARQFFIAEHGLIGYYEGI